MKSRLGIKVISLLLCVSMFIIQSGMPSVFAMEDGDSDAVKTMLIAEFLPLSENITKQTVPYGTETEALSLPNSLIVNAYVYSDEDLDTTLEIISIEDIGWIAEPNYNGTAGEYLFSPELLRAYSVLADTIPAISVTVEEQETGEQETEEQETEEEKTEEEIEEETEEQETEEQEVEEETEEQEVEEETEEQEIEEETEEQYEEEIYEFEDEIDIRLIEEGFEYNPKPLTLEDLIADFNVSPPFITENFMLMGAMAVEKNPSTIVISEDNENNARTGRPDDDMKRVMGGWSSNYPIEVHFSLAKLPVESAYIAIKAMDVDEEDGEMDYVFINDIPAGPGVEEASIGALAGNDNTWNTTVLEIPLSKLKLGKNYVSITISPGWGVTIDWIQIILDGGQQDSNISSFSIFLGEALQKGDNVEITSQIKIEQSVATEYYTEYMLTNSEGENLASYFGSAISTETATLSMPLNSSTGTYTVTGLIKDKTTETIKASDTVTFDFEEGEVPNFGPKLSYSLSPSTVTNGDVNIHITAENEKPEEVRNVEIWYEEEDITDSPGGITTTASQSVPVNGAYRFTIKYTFREAVRTAYYTVNVSNIDTTGPVIAADNISVVEDTPDAEVLVAIDNSITITDNVSLPLNPYSLSISSGFAATLEDKSIIITAVDNAGNETTEEITLTVVPKPVRMTQQKPDVTELTASLSAVLNNTRGLNITESGFVWGISQNPTYQVCNGKWSNTDTLSKGGSITGTAEGLAEGVAYYVRAYIKAGDSYYYSDQKSFGIGAPKYGSFSVTAVADNVAAGGGEAVFTISRPSNEVEGSQTVYCRTVNCTAVGGTHFIHNIGAVTFATGDASKSVSVTVNGVSRKFGDNYPATAYQNTGRSFYLEIYKIEGGATIGTGRVQKNIDLDSSKTVNADAYNQYNEVGNAQSTAYKITDAEFNDIENRKAMDTVNFSKILDSDAAYLDATSDYYGLKFDLYMEEDIEGYQNIQVTNRTTPYQFTHESNSINIIQQSSDAFYGVVFDIEGNSMGEGDFTFPEDHDSYVTDYRGELTDDETINIGKNRPVYVYYDASGVDDDAWYKSGFIPYVRAFDTEEPQLIGVAPMAGGAYSFGDEVYVSLVFDEIIGSVGSVSELTIDTNLSESAFVYVEGLGTNVLVFKGVVDIEGQEFGTVIIEKINGSNSIKDLADYEGSPTGSTEGSTEIDVNTIRPTVGFLVSSAGTLPRHSVEVEISDAASAKYVWTQSTAMPVSGWMDFPDLFGGTLSESLSSGIWYLHVLAVHTNGNLMWKNEQFEYQQPTMSVSADNSSWAQSRDITLALSSVVSVTVTMSGAGSGSYSAEENINVTANGTYIFTLTDNYGSSIVEYVEVSLIDRTPPVISISEYGDTTIKYTALDFGVSASDEPGGSGISLLQYAWSESGTTPESDWPGWTDMSIAGGHIPRYITPGPVYLHIKAVDNAGNTAYSSTAEYTVFSDAPPTITVTGGELSNWQREDVTIDYTVTIQEGGADIAKILAADTEIVEDFPSGGPYNGSVIVSENGLYTFVAIDENGLSDSKNAVINFIDKQAPVASFSYGEGATISSWAKSKTITVSAIDNNSPVVDANGIITGYGGSGIDFMEIKEGADGTYDEIENGGSFTLEENTDCYIRITDVVGNSTVYTLPVSGIDITVPDVNITTTDLWQNTPYDAVVTYSDDYSGIASARYAVAGDKTDIPAVLYNIPVSGGSITVSDNGSSYIYYEITDNAGNMVFGWSEEIKIDTVVPQLTVSANKGASDGEAYTSGEWTKEDVVFTLGNAVTQISGIEYKVSKDGGEYESISESTYTISEDTDAAYSFKAVSSSGKESSAVEYTVRIDNILPIISELFPANLSRDQSITPIISFTAEEPLAKGNGYLTVYNKLTNIKVMDVHSSSNRVKLSDDSKTLKVTLPQILADDTDYYIDVEQGFAADRAGNKMEVFGGKDVWSFTTAENPDIPDSEIVVLGYTVELISRNEEDGPTTSKILTAVNDRQSERQHNIITKAGYHENGIDYVKLKVVPTMSAVPELINVSSTEGTSMLSGDKMYIDVLIPGDKSEAIVTISLGNDSENQFSIKIINSSYKAVVEINGEIPASAEESNLLNSVDLSEQIEAEKQPNTRVDVTIMLIVEQKEETEIPDVQKIEQAVPGAVLKFLDITIEKVVTTTVEGSSPTTEREAVTATQQPVVIIIDLPEELQGMYDYKIVRMHNGVIDILPASLVDNGTRLRFETDRFSTYSIAYTEEQSSTVKGKSSRRRNTSVTSAETISSITAEGNLMKVEISRLSIYIEDSENINGMVPYYMEDNEENIVRFSAVADGELIWIADKGRTYLFKYNDKNYRDIEYHWAKNDILFTSARELFTGMSEGEFSPDAGMTRGMFVTVLGRLSGDNISSPAVSNFTDVLTDAWYASYVEWAAAAGIVNGYGNGLFGPEDEITKEQIALIINRFAKYTGLELNITSEGLTDILFDTKDIATRAEAAAVLKRFIDFYVVTEN